MRTLSYRIFFALCIGTAWVSLALARYGGPGYLMNAAATGAPGEVTCTACHSGGTGPGSLQLDIVQGPNVYTPGATYQLRASLQAPASLTGGIQLVALHTDSSMGKWIPATGMRTVQLSTFNNPTRQYLEHSSPKLTNAQGLTSWEFSWEAPLTQGISPVFYASSVASNDDFTPSGDRVYQTFLSFASLPVEWGDFTLIQKPGAVSVAWETKEETNSDRFEVQRSLDGHIFVPLGSLPAKGNTEELQRYTWSDEAPIYDQEVFYRIKQIDVNGQFSLSEVKQIMLNRQEVGLGNCYPNLVQAGDAIHFTYASEKENVLQVSFQTISGKRIKEMHIDMPEGLFRSSVSTSGLKPGRYTLLFKQEAFVEIRAILVY